MHAALIARTRSGDNSVACIVERLRSRYTDSRALRVWLRRRAEMYFLQARSHATVGTLLRSAVPFSPATDAPLRMACTPTQTRKKILITQPMKAARQETCVWQGSGAKRQALERAHR
jgi:hypothetical protein